MTTTLGALRRPTTFGSRGFCGIAVELIGPLGLRESVVSAVFFELIFV
jgi:hypothetical protein